jgi:exosome complex component RRP42
MASTSLSKAEKSYVQTSLLSTPPLRGDGRSPHEFRAIALETGVSPLANGSARIDIGRNAHDGGGGTEILAGVKLEVEDVQDGDGIDGGKVICTVSWYVMRFFLVALFPRFLAV